MAKRFLKIFTIWSIGALSYGTIEIASRGFSHISMGILGGICLLMVGVVNKKLDYEIPIRYKMLICAVIITSLEYVTGIIVNIWLRLDVWDYSCIAFNVSGQICLPFFVIWFFLSYIAILLDAFIRCKIFNEEKPHYRLMIFSFRKV